MGVGIRPVGRKIGRNLARTMRRRPDCHDGLRERRATRVCCAKIRMTETPVTEVAYDSGFENLSIFPSLPPSVSDEPGLYRRKQRPSII